MSNAYGIVDTSVARGVYHVTFTLLGSQNPTVEKVSDETILDSGIPTADVVGIVYTVIDRPEVLQFSDDPNLTPALNETGALVSPVILLPADLNPDILWDMIFNRVNNAVSEIEAAHIAAVFPRIDEFFQAIENAGMDDHEQLGMLKVLYMFGRSEQVRPAAEAALDGDTLRRCLALSDQIKLAVFEKLGLWL